jgi:hypothetical protein
MYRDTTNVEPVCKIIPVITGVTGIVSFTTKDSYTWNITHNTESTAG